MASRLIFATILVLLTAGCRAPAPASPVPTAGKSAASAAAPATRSPSTATPTPPATATPRPSTPTPTSSPSAPSPSPTPRPNIVVSEPVRDQIVKAPVTVSGEARVFEATVELEVVAEGKVLGRGFTTATKGAPEWGTFTAQVHFTAPRQEEVATVRVFSRSARDGSIQDLVEVPVRIQARPSTPSPTPTPRASPTPTGPAAGMRRLQIYFPKEVNNNVTFVAVHRDVPTTQSLGRVAVEELLKGPTPEEEKGGLYTAIPKGVRLLGLKIDEGVAYADFDRQIEEKVGGSVRVMAIRRSIDLTLRQFSTIDKVVISVEGKTEGVLQP